MNWEVGYDWDDDARSNMAMTTVKVSGSDVDIYDHLRINAGRLFEALEGIIQVIYQLRGLRALGAILVQMGGYYVV